ncbi:hypothetical protein ColTof4_04925 [Colletotrichum tofieldiae]|nr:hypothetical protein ColTof3_10828 [Colletotrichum tofieldiae]GKT72502.1 hypothetical protein ColTof4_04925 [Colletotrichum tofieldiae]GKT89665.1 hypothetical protein Ct61P_07515 [Colletotrichum tofieldiae]
MSTAGLDAPRVQRVDRREKKFPFGLSRKPDLTMEKWMRSLLSSRGPAAVDDQAEHGTGAGRG